MLAHAFWDILDPALHTINFLGNLQQCYFTVEEEHAIQIELFVYVAR